MIYIKAASYGAAFFRFCDFFPKARKNIKKFVVFFEKGIAFLYNKVYNKICAKKCRRFVDKRKKQKIQEESFP